MRIVNRCVFGFIAASVSAFAGARDLPPDQPPIWSTKPDVNAFEKIENDRLDAAHRWIGKIVAAKGPNTIGTPLPTSTKAPTQLHPPSHFPGRFRYSILRAASIARIQARRRRQGRCNPRSFEGAQR